MAWEIAIILPISLFSVFLFVIGTISKGISQFALTLAGSSFAMIAMYIVYDLAGYYATAPVVSVIGTGFFIIGFFMLAYVFIQFIQIFQEAIYGMKPKADQTDFNSDENE